MHTAPRFRLSDYARIRLAQSRLPMSALESLLLHGRSEPQRDGGQLVILDRASLGLVEQPELRGQLRRYLGTYAVLGRDGAVHIVGRLN